MTIADNARNIKTFRIRLSSDDDPPSFLFILPPYLSSEGDLSPNNFVLICFRSIKLSLLVTIRFMMVCQASVKNPAYGNGVVVVVVEWENPQQRHRTIGRTGKSYSNYFSPRFIASSTNRSSKRKKKCSKNRKEGEAKEIMLL